VRSEIQEKRRIYNLRWREKNREHVRRKQKEWYWTHLEQARKSHRTAPEKNLEQWVEGVAHSVELLENSRHQWHLIDRWARWPSWQRDYVALSVAEYDRSGCAIEAENRTDGQREAMPDLTYLNPKNNHGRRWGK
jgi:hypothetical protein